MLSGVNHGVIQDQLVVPAAVWGLALRSGVGTGAASPGQYYGMKLSVGLPDDETKACDAAWAICTPQAPARSGRLAPRRAIPLTAAAAVAGSR